MGKVVTMVLPAEFDPDVYRGYPDLARFSDDDLRDHFNRHGEAEGRWASRINSRQDFLHLIDGNDSTIELGPFCNPQLTGPKVAYFDVLDREKLIERAASLGVAIDRTPVIDYCSPVGDLSVVERKFSVVFSSHCIEHQPDLLHHLNCVRKILNERGRYFLIIPDKKRYCFDHFLSESSLAEVVAAFHEGRRTHVFRSVFEHRLSTCHNDPIAHWRGEHGNPPQPDAAGLRHVKDEWAAAAGGYIDVHAWQFTPKSFRSIIQTTFRLGLHEFEVERVYSTLHGTMEFFAVLRRS